MASSAAGEIPEIRWEHGDDLCDCTFQRIGWWTNPYLARTLEIRLCCMWERLNEMFPGLMREIPAFTDYNNGNVFITEPQMWNGEDDMPEHLWHRQIAIITGMSLPEVREKFAGEKPPKGKKRAESELASSGPLRMAGAGRGDAPGAGDQSPNGSARRAGGTQDGAGARQEPERVAVRRR